MVRLLPFMSISCDQAAALHDAHVTSTCLAVIPAMHALVQQQSERCVSAVDTGTQLLSLEGASQHVHAQDAVCELARCDKCCRSQEQRTGDGIPELRFGARGKGAALTVPSLQRSSFRQLRGGGDLVYNIAALQILGLRQVRVLTECWFTSASVHCRLVSGWSCCSCRCAHSMAPRASLALYASLCPHDVTSAALDGRLRDACA